jgi:thiol-disulfide isomerase/thioredoxin
MINKLIFFLAVILIVSCGKDLVSPKPGNWRAVLQLDQGRELPFIAQYNANNTLVVVNAEEEIEVTEVNIKGDSIIIQLPVFEGVLKGVFTDTTIIGDFVKPSVKRIVPFEMRFGNAARFKETKTTEANVTGSWETVFSPDSEEDRYIAKGIFKQIGNKVTGTFRTATGDYRFLEGVINGDSLKLSTFDGAHAFLFEAKVTDSAMNGVFYSGNHWQEPFIAQRNESYELPEADSLTFLKAGFERFEFSFPDTNGKLVSLNDEKFKNKVILVQIMGSWCPNCLDETKFYSRYFKENKNKNLEIVALAFEYAPTKEKAVSAINRLVNAIEVPYPVLLAQYGSVSKTEANEKLPMLSHVLSYPTTIFIDKAGKVRKIHTGFNGPATGEKYTDFVSEFKSFLSQLLEE